MIYKGKGGLQYDLFIKPFATGGEGELYDIVGQPGLVAKVYKPGKASVEKERKLVKMVNEPPDKSVLSQIAWPRDVLYNSGQFIGFVMPKMETFEDLNVVYEYGSSAKYPHMSWENRIIIAENLCAVLHSVHAVGHVCGDLNPKNISVNPNTGQIVFLDTDSYHIHDGPATYRCDVGIPEYLPVEIQRKMHGGVTFATATLPTFSQDTDNFALAIHIFQLLMNGVHPFACAIIPSQASVAAPQPSDNILKGDFPFIMSTPGVKIPAYAPRISILPKEIQDLFKRAFIKGHSNPNTRPTPVEWHTALRKLRSELKVCGVVSHHQYYTSLSRCPWCEVNNAFSRVVAPNKPVLTQTFIKPPQIPPQASPPQQNVPAQSSSYSQPPTKNKGSSKPQKGTHSGTRKFAVLIQIFVILLPIFTGVLNWRLGLILAIIPFTCFSLIFFRSKTHGASRGFGLIVILLFSLFLIAHSIEYSLPLSLWIFILGNPFASIIAFASPKTR